MVGTRASFREVGRSNEGGHFCVIEHVNRL